MRLRWCRGGRTQNLESLAKRIARFNRTLTFILSIKGRGEEKSGGEVGGYAG